MTAQELIALVRDYNPRCNEALLAQAYAFGEAMHEGQFRQSGEPYFTHPVAVAELLTQQRLDDATIITALLHDTIEDTKASYSEVAARFGSEVAELVDGVTKLTNLELTNRESKQAENFRKLFVAMSRDLRVILVKLADRLHNMRTIKAMRPEKQQQKARETMDIFAPLAGRMGMQWMRDELEDLSFAVLEPDRRQSIIRRFARLQKESGDVIDHIKTDMQSELEAAGVRAALFGRAKRPYSIWRKMQDKNQGFSRLSDIYGFRVLVDSEEDCYRALGAIHQRWRAVPGRFKDYISQPKSNGYRSIHTTVSGRDGKRVEVQIRTRPMHDVAESGVAAHWSYRDGERAENPFAVDPARWIEMVAEHIETEDDHEDFLEAVKLEMYSDQVFCFTPKGDVIKLPRGATPLDFAYAIHTRIGAAVVGAKVDGKRVPLWTQLRNGQSCEVITAQGQTPQVSWLEIAKTGKARSAIRRALRMQDRAQYIRLGRELMRAAFEHIDKRLSDKAIETAARHLALPSAEELLMRLGSAELSSQKVIAALYPELSAPSGDPIPRARALIGLSEGQSFRRGECCLPLPGERIVGITSRGKGVMVHAMDCRKLAQYEDQHERWLGLHWQAGTHQAIYGVVIEMTIGNDAGVLGRICTLIGEKQANISDLEFADRKPDFFRLFVRVEVRDAEQLHSLMLALEADGDVAALQRHRHE